MIVNVFEIATQIFWILIIASCALMSYKVLYFIVGLMSGKKLPKAKVDHNYVVLIPARNESKVVERLFKSIQAQDYNREKLDFYVIVESLEDPTVEIAKKYGLEVFVRKSLHLKGKGWALDEVCKKILASKNKDKYEAYFVIDADNELAPNFFTEMNKAFDAGYQFGKCNMEIANANSSWVSCSTGVTFSLINTFGNKARFQFNGQVIISGTGFYMDAKFINDYGGWPYHSLTEDYEMSMNSLIHGYSTAYISEPIIKDYAPTNLKNSWNQRKRWVKGYAENYGIYKSQLYARLRNFKKFSWSALEQIVGVLPIILFIISYVSFNLFSLALSIYGAIFSLPFALTPLFTMLFYDGLLYLALMGLTLFILLGDKSCYKIGFKTFIQTLFLNPLFMLLYIPIATQAIFTKKVEWVPIEREAVELNGLEDENEEVTENFKN